MYKIDLNGLWDFVIDLDPKYHNSRIYSRHDYSRSDWDRNLWQKVEVPGVWNKYSEQLDIYEGVCWFAREFFVGEDRLGSSAQLRFGGVNYKCRIFLNDRQVGVHEGGYTEFTVDVTKDVKSGRNHLAVEVDNRSTEIRLPPCLGWFNYGGIHRDVSLEIYDKAYMAEIFFNGRYTSRHSKEDGCTDGTGILSVSGVLTGVFADYSDLVIVLECQGKNTQAVSLGDGAFSADLALPVEPWTPDSPVLYTATLKLLNHGKIIHEHITEVGFRTIGIHEGKILLNGKEFFLKGICYLYDSPVYGVTFKPEQYEYDLDLLKELGVNTIRSHFPFPEEFYRECDRKGMMVWIETPVYCIDPGMDEINTAFSDPVTRKLANSMYREMIIAARSHPSVIIYGMGNECNVEHPEAEDFFREITANARDLDGTRMLSYASLYCNVGPLADMVDILGINEYWGWYDKILGGKGLASKGKDINVTTEAVTETIDLKILDDKLNELKQIHKTPLLLTEFSADSIPGYISNSRELWSEDYHACLLTETFAVIERHPDICGAFPFGFSDYRDPSKTVNGYWDYMNYKGVVSYERRPKKAFYALKSIYAKGENAK